MGLLQEYYKKSAKYTSTKRLQQYINNGKFDIGYLEEAKSVLKKRGYQW